MRSAKVGETGGRVEGGKEGGGREGKTVELIPPSELKLVQLEKRRYSNHKLSSSSGESREP